MNHIDLAAFCDLIFVVEPNFNLFTLACVQVESYESLFNLFSTMKFNK
jgi:hypothetical protein